MLYVKRDGSLDVCHYKVTFVHNDSFQTKFENDRRKWVEFASQWSDLEDLKTQLLTLTDVQQSRFDEVKGAFLTGQEFDRWLAELSEYVRFGAVNVDTICPALVDKVGSPEAEVGNLEQALTHQRELLSFHRYKVETGGVELPNGNTVDTNRAHQAQLSSVHGTLKEGLVEVIDFKGPDGWITATLTEIRPLFQAVTNHVQKAFRVERQVEDALTALETAQEAQDYLVVEEFTRLFEGEAS